MPLSRDACDLMCTHQHMYISVWLSEESYVQIGFLHSITLVKHDVFKCKRYVRSLFFYCSLFLYFCLSILVLLTHLLLVIDSREPCITSQLGFSAFLLIQTRDSILVNLMYVVIRRCFWFIY